MHNAENDKTAYVQSVEAAVTTAVQSAEAKNSGAGAVDQAKPAVPVTVQLVVISGRSGSGKTVALRCLEALGYYCIDKSPVMFVRELTDITPDR